MKGIKLLSLAALSTALLGCTVSPQDGEMVANRVDLMKGVDVEKTKTPYSTPLQCLAQFDQKNGHYGVGHDHKISVAVGNIVDRTGKYEVYEGGHTVTQGATDMMTSALMKTSAVRLVYRGDTNIMDYERSLSARNLVSEYNEVSSPKMRRIRAGEFVGSEYLITGAITEVNYNIGSGGAEVGVSGVGAQHRTFAMDVGIDLFLINTVTTEIVDHVSLRKQVVGYETDVGVYRFFGSELFDMNVGEKKQEPIQLGIRTAIEASALHFVRGLYELPEDVCTGK